MTPRPIYERPGAPKAFVYAVVVEVPALQAVEQIAPLAGLYTNPMEASQCAQKWARKLEMEPMKPPYPEYLLFSGPRGTVAVEHVEVQ